jgi:hypothetical protein
VDDQRVTDLHAHLAATAEQPVERVPARYLGEAEAVAADAVAAADAGNREAVRRRLGQVRDLLASVEATGDARADEHLREARALAADLLEGEGEGDEPDE